MQPLQPAANEVPYNITDTTNDIPPSSQNPPQQSHTTIDISHHYIITLRVSLALFTVSLILVLVLTILYFVRRKQHLRAKRDASRRVTRATCIYDNHVDILNSEGADICAMERAFGTGVLVIGDSPMVHQRLTMGEGSGGVGGMSGGGGGTLGRGYLSTADSDVENFA